VKFLHKKYRIFYVFLVKKIDQYFDDVLTDWRIEFRLVVDC